MGVCEREREEGGGRTPIPSLQPAGPQPLTSPRRCTIARCHRCPLRVLSRQRKMPRVPAVRIPTSARPRPHPHPGGPARRACLPGGLLSAERLCLIPFFSWAATSLGAPCSRAPQAHAGQLLPAGWGRGAVAGGKGWEAESKLSTLHPSLPQLLSMPSSPASPLGGLSVSTRSCSGFSWQPAGGRR